MNKKIIAREGFIILAFTIVYAICLSVAFLFPFTTIVETICLVIIATVVFCYLLYIIVRFTIWAIKILREK